MEIIVRMAAEGGLLQSNREWLAVVDSSIGCALHTRCVPVPIRGQDGGRKFSDWSNRKGSGSGLHYRRAVHCNARATGVTASWAAGLLAQVLVPR